MTQLNQSKTLDGCAALLASEEAHEMEVLCACDERYLPHAATMLCSLLENNQVCRIHLFHSSIDTREVANLKSLVSQYGSDIALYDIVAADFQHLRVDKWASIAAYYRLLAPRLLPPTMDKVLYLDCDIVVMRSLGQLWNTDVTGHAVAAVANHEDTPGMALGLPEGTRYFNTGVLLINLQFWRQNDIAQRAVAFVRNNPEKVQYWDQDALNAILAGQWIELPSYWNWQDWLPQSARAAGTPPAIVHFIGDIKPWQWPSEHPFKHEYLQHRRKTPWRYKPEGAPSLPHRLALFLRGLAHTGGSGSLASLRRIAERGVPRGIKQWSRSHRSKSRA